MVVKKVDINCDLGEGLDNEAALMPYLSSCNIACGGHAGDNDTIRTVARLAHAHKVKIGAHPSFPDKENFGRVVMDITPEDLRQSLSEQIKNFQRIIIEEGLELHHIKPHGALYNIAAQDHTIAALIVDLILELDSKLVLYSPYNSVIADIAIEKGLRIAYEVFLDRNYNDDLSLVSRQKKDAFISDSEVMYQHLIRMLQEGKVRTVSGALLPIKADTFCIHGDGENAVENLKYIAKKLEQERYKIG